MFQSESTCSIKTCSRNYHILEKSQLIFVIMFYQKKTLSIPYLQSSSYYFTRLSDQSTTTSLNLPTRPRTYQRAMPSRLVVVSRCVKNILINDPFLFTHRNRFQYIARCHLCLFFFEKGIFLALLAIIPSKFGFRLVRVFMERVTCVFLQLFD